ncbi:uncharacterized protein LOC62_05G007749 [Vanrija pseudolonga]|uniref:Uncharacterized protein n=1 Tax=Vanrija pseudolonga TaxID=143232 RepID=A0AAF0YE30_9TREE|nr:hypothetical protein LOC62_05G007749 [Vanrija pseudolonga]
MPKPHAPQPQPHAHGTSRWAHLAATADDRTRTPELSHDTMDVDAGTSLDALIAMYREQVGAYPSTLDTLTALDWPLARRNEPYAHAVLYYYMDSKVRMGFGPGAIAAQLVQMEHIAPQHAKLLDAVRAKYGLEAPPAVEEGWDDKADKWLASRLGGTTL